MLKEVVTADPETWLARRIHALLVPQITEKTPGPSSAEVIDVFKSSTRPLRTHALL